MFVNRLSHHTHAHFDLRIVAIRRRDEGFATHTRNERGGAGDWQREGVCRSTNNQSRLTHNGFVLGDFCSCVLFTAGTRAVAETRFGRATNDSRRAPQPIPTLFAQVNVPHFKAPELCI